MNKTLILGILFTVAVLLQSCGSSQKTADKAAQSYCNCSRGASEMLAKINKAANHEEKMKLVPQIQSLVNSMSECMAASEGLKSYEKAHDKAKAKQKLSMEQQLNEAKEKGCPEVRQAALKIQEAMKGPK